MARSDASFRQRALSGARHRLFLWMAAGVFALASIQTGNAQTLSSIGGTVTDSSGAVIGNAKVTVKNDATQVSKTAETSSAGTYTVTDLIPGTYTVTVDDAGFQSSVHNGVGVDVGRASTVDAVMQPGNTQQTVTVSENAIALDTTAPSLNTTIENKVVQELPNQISGGRGRQIDNFIFLAPGVTGSTFSHRINGGVDFQNEVVFNGIPMAQSETQGYQTIWNPPFELVGEFNVLRSSFSAQYGLAQGVITYQTASGTNTFHGDAFDIIRNNFFDARGAYNPTVPIDKENNYGFTIGGPVIIPKLYNGKNRTFFHISMEWFRQNQTTTTFFSLPTAAEKSGNFSGLVDSTGKQVPIYNPAAGQPGSCNAGGNTPGTQFRGNIIPSACFSALSTSLLPLIPTPALPGFINNSQSLIGVLPVRQNPWGFTIDHNITDKQSIHWAEWRDNQSSNGEGNNLPLNNPLANNTFFPNLGTVFILNYSYAINPHLVMTAGASWLGELNFQIPQRAQVDSLPPAPGAPLVSGINFVGPLSPGNLGTSNTNSINRKLGLVAENNYLYIHGKNTFNIGWEFRRTYQDDNECQQCAGNFGFSNNETADPNNLSNTGNSFASFLLGTVDTANRTGSQELRLSNTDVSTYIQDDIKLTPKFTFNIGVRWDVMVPFREKNNNIVYFDSTIPNPGAGGRLGAATKFGYCIGCASTDRAFIHWNHFSPRTGFSYQLNEKTVLQSGFSVNFLNGGAYEYGISKVAVNYGNLLLGTFQRPSTGSTNPAFGSWDNPNNILPNPAPTPFSPTLGIGSNALNGFDPVNDGVAPYDAVWNIGIQRELPSNLFLTVNYTGNRANHLPSQLNPINQIGNQYLAYGSNLGQPYATVGRQLGIPLPYPTFLNDFPTATVQQALRPYPQYSNIFNNFDMTGSSLYHALQIQAQKRYSNGLSFLVSYNLSRLMSSTSSGFTSFAGKALDKNNQKSEWSIDNNDEPNAVTIAATYELPFGKGRTFMNHGGISNVLLGGWQISPLLSYASGTPLQVTVAGDPLGTGASNRPNVVPGVSQQFSYNNVYKGLPVLNAAAFQDPGPWVPGNEKRYIPGIRNQFLSNENLAVAKYFPIGERVRLKLEIEYFNVLNRVNFSGSNCSVDTNLNDANFGKSVNCQNNTQRQGQGYIEVRF
ncbi:MAG TPA: TonB-dependent receptor [Bryobacteraceae bacterium]|nr:TonB-dependent receptor [Bryobacteraceae bacterium]